MASQVSETMRTPRLRSRASVESRQKRALDDGLVSAVRRRSTRSKLDYVLEDQVGFQLRLAMQRHTAIFVGNMVLTQTQFATIVKLNEVGPCSQNQLARMVTLDAATINGVLDRLRKRGYVSTEPDMRDGRQRVITITDSGRAVVEQAVKVAKKVTEETLTPLSKPERAQLSKLLRKIS